MTIFATKTFEGSSDFEALRAAETHLRARGFSYGSSERGAPTGVMYGEFDISKWRNLSAEDRKSLDGAILAGDHRNGPVVIVIQNEKVAGKFNAA